MMPQPNASFGPLSLIFAPTTWSVKLVSPYSRLMKGASGKYAGAKWPLLPDGVPIWLTNGGAKALPVKPKFGPVAPINGNCRKGCPPTLQGGPAGRNSGLNPVNAVEPLTRTGGKIIAAPVHSVVALKNSCEFGR